MKQSSIVQFATGQEISSGVMHMTKYVLSAKTVPYVNALKSVGVPKFSIVMVLNAA